jgi:hypothetical protein
MSELKEYTVTVKKREDLDAFYEDMQTPGGNLYIPDRAVDVSLERPMSRNTNYMLTEEEANQIKGDPRVMDVVLTKLVTAGITPAYLIDDAQIDRYPNYTANSKNWGLLAHRYKGNLNDLYGSAGTTLVGDSYAVQTNYSNVINNKRVSDVNITASGKNVDVLIVDGHIFKDHPEFAKNPDGTGGSRVVQIDWKNYALQAIGKTITNSYNYSPYKADGITLRYGADHGNHVAGTAAGNTQGWARNANIYNISPYSTDNTDNATYVSNIYDFIRAWHNSKPINPETGRKNPTVFNGSYSSSHSLLGYAIPTWRIYYMNYRGVATTFPFIEPTTVRAGLDINDVSTWQLNPDGTSIRSDPGMLDLIARNCTASSTYFSYFFLNYVYKTSGAAKLYFEPEFASPAYIAAAWVDVEDMIADGIIVVGAGGNDGSTAAREGELDFNNHMKVGSKRNADGTITDWTLIIPSPYYYNRGSAPGSVTGAICVGAMESAPGRTDWGWTAAQPFSQRNNSQYRTNKTSFSKRGTRVDIWAAGRHIMSPYGEKSGGTNTNPDPRNPSYFNASISGTSMASPQVTGVCACLAEVFPNMKPAEMIEYLRYHSQKNALDNYSISVTNDNFTDFGLNGAPNYILYMPETRPLKDSVYPMAKFKIRKTSGRVFPRPRIRRKG